MWSADRRPCSPWRTHLSACWASFRWWWMPDGRPSLEDFWRRLEMRHVEPDLAAMLRERTTREVGSVRRLADQATVEAVAGRLLPGAVPAPALAVFLDENFDRQLGRAEEGAGRLPRDKL